MSGTNVVEFFRQVRQEGLKVTWGTRKETLTSTSIVLVMVLISSAFFWTVDKITFWLTQAIMGF